MIGTPIFFQNIPNIPNNNFNNSYNIGNNNINNNNNTIGNWVCQSCKNLNFAFRLECNRCHLHKPSEDKNKKDKFDNNINYIKEKRENKDTQESKGYKRSFKYKKTNNHHNKNKGNEN